MAPERSITPKCVCADFALQIRTSVLQCQQQYTKHHCSGSVQLRLFSGHDIQELPKGPSATAVASYISQLAITSNVTDSRICSLVSPKI